MDDFNLQQVSPAPSYRSSRHKLSADFYVPCLAVSSEYWRAAGYFTSGSMQALAEGLGPFIESQGKIRLVVSPYLSEEDIVAINAGYEDRARILEESLLQQLQLDDLPKSKQRHIAVLSWLIANNRLDIKVALTSSGGSVGIYHEKFGLFFDRSGNEVAFSGSANESMGGLVSNFESVDVFCSWKVEDCGRVDRKKCEFAELWDGTTPELEIYNFPEAARERLLALSPPGDNPPEWPREPKDTALRENIASSVADDRRLRCPSSLELRPYQHDAIQAWLDAGGRGIWEMATGTGKTITALGAITKIHDLAREAKKPMLTIIVCPFQHLVTQWDQEVRNWGGRALLCFRSREGWFGELSQRLATLRLAGRGSQLLITTNATFAGSPFQEILSRWNGPMTLVVDEVHNAGSGDMSAKLPETADYRLGLSATPDRWMDPVGTQAIREYFGATVFELGLAEAVTDLEVLVPYRYNPVVVELDEEEADEYTLISKRLGAVLAGSGEVDGTAGLPESVKALLIKRARLLGGARAKLDALEREIKPFRAEPFNLVYCSDAKVGVSGPRPRQIDAVIRLLGRELGMRAHTYTHEEDQAIRAQLSRRFSDGELQTLVAIRCLDEGVDIPATRRAFILASSTNPRQFIQRRGRILRRSPGKERADLFDFMVVLSPQSPDVDWDLERRLVERELRRAYEFASVAQNGPQARHALMDLAGRYNLRDLG